MDIASSGHNVLIHGHCGTGKSFTLKEIVRALRAQKKTVAVTSTSGVSSLLLKELGSQTIHHWCGLQDGRLDDTQLVHAVLKTESKRGALQRIEQCDVLVIDEIGKNI